MSTETIFKCPRCTCRYESTNILKYHMIMEHPNKINSIPEETWNNLNLYKCHLCTTGLFTKKNALTRHINTTHKSKTEQLDNIKQITALIPPPPSSNHKWDITFQRLYNFRITHPPFWQNIWLKTN